MSISQGNFYRLIKPYDSNLLHISSTMMGGASKCYKELKKVTPGANNFSIINTKTNQLYEFDINNNLQIGGGTTASLSEIELLKRHIDSLEKRIIKLENNNEQTQPLQNEGNGTNATVIGTNDGVTILGANKTLPPQRPQLISTMMKTEQNNSIQPLHQMQQSHQMQQVQSMQQSNGFNQDLARKFI